MRGVGVRWKLEMCERLGTVLASAKCMCALSIPFTCRRSEIAYVCTHLHALAHSRARAHTHTPPAQAYTHTYTRSSLVSLKVLDIRKNDFRALPDTLEFYTDLRKLNVSHNHLVNLGGVLRNCVLLEEIWAQVCRPFCFYRHCSCAPESSTARAASWEASGVSRGSIMFQYAAIFLLVAVWVACAHVPFSQYAVIQNKSAYTSMHVNHANTQALTCASYLSAGQQVDVDQSSCGQSRQTRRLQCWQQSSRIHSTTAWKLCGTYYAGVSKLLCAMCEHADAFVHTCHTYRLSAIIIAACIYSYAGYTATTLQGCRLR
jgi:hypothetical protein